jgi:hypothetical protein
MRISKRHFGVGFEVWESQHAWFWFVRNPHREGGTIGAAATESEAVRQARLSIEEIIQFDYLEREGSLGNLGISSDISLQSVARLHESTSERNRNHGTPARIPRRAVGR